MLSIVFIKRRRLAFTCSVHVLSLFASSPVKTNFAFTEYTFAVSCSISNKYVGLGTNSPDVITLSYVSILSSYMSTLLDVNSFGAVLFSFVYLLHCEKKKLKIQ